ncbi:UNVERIFIED_CONTAM: hypothetical protein RMT77_018752 [Armadillidium vulgare]
MIRSGMEAYFPFFPSSKPNNPWFNDSCSGAICRRDATFRKYRHLQTPESHETYISSRNRAKSTLCNTKIFFPHKNPIIFLVPVPLSLISNWGRENTVVLNASNIQFLHNVNSNFASSSFSSLVSSGDTNGIYFFLKLNSSLKLLPLIQP